MRKPSAQFNGGRRFHLRKINLLQKKMETRPTDASCFNISLERLSRWKF
ncbi:MAG: hypothetical protein ACTS6G_03505 [Candidatus Hodgkinia cicadicola]